MTTKGASYHAAQINSAFSNPNSPSETVCLEALEYLLGIRVEAEEHAGEFINRSKAKTESTDAKAFGEALHQDFADMLSRVKLAREVASCWEKSGQRIIAACGQHIMEILGR